MTFIFLVDFLILDMEGTDVAHRTPIILGRPFLATTNARIDYRTGEMDVSFGNKRLRINIFDTATRATGNDECFPYVMDVK